MRFKVFAAIAAASFLLAGPLQAQSPAFEAYKRYSDALDQAVDDMDAAADDGDKYAGCRAMERAMTNARSAANSIIDLIDEVKAEPTLSQQERSEMLTFYDDMWSKYDRMAKQVSNEMDVCAGVNYR